MHVLSSKSLLTESGVVGGAKFARNSAAMGGGLFIEDCRSAKIRAGARRDLFVVLLPRSCVQILKTTWP